MERLQPGVPNFDVELVDYCFHCDAEALAVELAKELGYAIVGRGVGPQTATLSKDTLRIIRYEGCEWSVVVPAEFEGGEPFENSDLMARLSKSLNTDVLFLGISDAAGGVEYRYFRDGRLIEEISFDSEGDGEYDPESEEPGYEDIDRKVRELGIIPPMLFRSPFEEVGKTILALTDIDGVADQIAEALILQKNIDV